jgi:micrococcal nuclease
MYLRILIALTVLVMACLPVLAQPVYRAIDGDTLALGDERFRLTGFDTPETFQALCPAEKAHGLRAKARLAELVARGPVYLQRARGKDKYGRTLAVLWIGQELASAILIREGLAVPYTGRIRRVANHNWCASL